MVLGILLLGMPLAIVVSALIYLPFYLKGRKALVPWQRHLGLYMFIGCCFIILFATVLIGMNFNRNYRLLNLIPFIWIFKTYEMGGARMLQQLLLNVLMFVPFGILLPLGFSRIRSFWRVIGMSFGLSFMIEFIQYFTGRSADIDDLLTNILGGGIGFLIYLGLDYLFKQQSWWKKFNGIRTEIEDLEVEPVLS